VNSSLSGTVTRGIDGTVWADFATNPSLNKTACYFEQQVNIRGSAFYRLAILSYSAHEKPPQQTCLSMQGIFFYLPFANNPEQ
jgi:Flp pilus assembly protein TadD